MSWIDSDGPQKQCCECFLWYPADNSHYARQYEGRYGLASRCKLCTKEMQSVLRELKAAPVSYTHLTLPTNREV